MNALVIGDADSIWIKSIIEKTFLPYKDKITVLSNRNNLYKEFYDIHNVKVVSYKHSKNKILSAIYRLLAFRVLFSGFDVVNIHSVGGHLMYLPVAKLFNKRVVVSFWGSDIFRRNNRDKKLYFNLNFADNITLSTKEMVDKFHLIFGYKFDSKIRSTHFGSNGIDDIKDNKETISEIKKEYQIDEDKIVVSIGYNKMFAQQHLKALESVKRLCEQDRKGIHIILRLTYGDGDKSYIEKIKNTLIDIDCTYTMLLDYLSDLDIARLTKITDIFIHAQISDARSASIQEHLYAGCLLLNPIWICYSDFEDKIYFLKYNDFEELTEILSDNLYKKTNSPLTYQLMQNKDIVYSFASWESYIHEWREVYKNK